MLFSFKLVGGLLTTIILLYGGAGSAQTQKAPDRTLQSQGLFPELQLTARDGLFVSNSAGDILYQWQADKALIPASLTKLITAHLAIKKWGLDHRFVTEFYVLENDLWVKGYGDPYLVSEELDLIVTQIKASLNGSIGNIQSISVDSSAIARELFPGRTQRADPYNAPLSAVAANFNTVTLKRLEGSLFSAEPQTPLTQTAKSIAKITPAAIGKKPNRVNLINVDHAQQHFAELLSLKLDLLGDDRRPMVKKQLRINQSLPAKARLILSHKNSKTLAEVLRGSLEYSNNFIANQLFLLLADDLKGEQLNFLKSKAYVKQQLVSLFSESYPIIDDGAGLARSNKISVKQLNQVLTELKPHQTLLRRYDLVSPIGSNKSSIYAHAKTGTLNGVRSFAGFLSVDQRQYQFVFIFNRKTPYRYREQLLQSLTDQIVRD